VCSSDLKKQESTGYTVTVFAGQPTRYQYTGVVTYLDGTTGTVQAMLIKDDSELRIQSINVNASTERLKVFQEKSKNASNN
jgi:hypothetical protein